MRLNTFTASEKDLAGLQTELEHVWREAEQQKATACKSMEDLAEELKTRLASEKRIAEIKEDLKSATAECDTLKDCCEKDAAELKKLKADCREATSQARAFKEEIQQATDIAAGKPYLLQCIFGNEAHPVLTQKWHICQVSSWIFPLAWSKRASILAVMQM